MLEKILSPNEGNVDRAVRVAAGLGLLSLTVLGPQTAWGLLGLIPLATGLLGSCPAYTLLGIKTCPLKKPHPTAS